MQEEQLYAKCKARLTNFYLSKLLCICPSLFKKSSAKQDIAFTEISVQFLALKIPILRRNKGTNSSTSKDPFSAAMKTLVLGNSFRLVRLAVTVARAVCRWDNEKNKTIVIFFFIFIPKWQTSRANLMSSLRSLNKLPNTRALSAAKKWMVRSTGVVGSISPHNGNLRR